MASIQKRGANSYTLRVELGYDTEGNRVRKLKTIKGNFGKRELEKELAKFVAEVESGQYISLDKMTFEYFITEWRTKFVERNLEAKTIVNYLYHVNKRILPHFGKLRMDKIKTMHIVDYLEKLHDQERIIGKGKLSSATIVYNYRVLRSIFSKAVDWKVIKENPIKGVTKPKEKSKEMDVYNDEEVKFVIGALANEKQLFRILILLAITTGLRCGELLGLEWKHIDLEHAFIEVKQSIPMFKDGQPIIKEPKTKNSIRKVSVPQFVIDELRAFQLQCKKDRLKLEEKWEGGERFFVFCNWNGKPFYTKTPSDMWRRFIKKYPQMKYIRFHDLRHTSATLLINQGVHAKIISNRLGHSNIGTTMNVYGHAIESADKAAASKFDSFFEVKQQKQL
ncbi:site-specific integrase [Paenibacillus anseongense]|uniref:tyrosine-type recombinase/integrase n=1 Tax=Paenibacillus anseongense TaxID=2682845 RepID=UPI002DBB0469|nr:site-specific integrase [Paenibacillus anseongense]MEC0269361.1 site-specific integrase [Paenibacillus anseongense]